MCGRFTLHHSTEDIAERFLVEQTMLDLVPRYNIAPSQPVPLIVQRNSRTLDAFKWGLVPSWAKDPDIGNRMINARAESVAEKPAFRSALRYRRCLVPASGYYEWKRQGDGKVPHFIHRTDGQPFAMAGLWEEWTTSAQDVSTSAQDVSTSAQDVTAPEQAVLRTCAIITTEPNPFAATIHTRMPAILAPEAEDKWLTPGVQNLDDLLAHLQPYNGDLAAHPVSTRVNRPNVDDPTCIAPVQIEDDTPPQLTLQF